MILTHLEAKNGEVLVRKPDGETCWVSVSGLIELAESDSPKRSEPKPEADGEPIATPKAAYRKRKPKATPKAAYRKRKPKATPKAAYRKRK